MCVHKKIDGYIEYFSEMLEKIGAVDERLFRKILYVSFLDCLSLCAYPDERGNRRRFVRFIDDFSGWEDSAKVSSWQLYLALKNEGLTNGKLFRTVSNRVHSWQIGNEMSLSGEPSFDEIVGLTASDAERRLLEKTRFRELLYIYRNHLVHEVRQPRQGIEWADENDSPFFHSVDILDGPMTWPLVFPPAFFERICRTALNGLKARLHEEQRNPYDSHVFGDCWLQ